MGGASARELRRETLRRYADVLALWERRFDTAEIAQKLALPEGLVAMWIAHWRDLLVEGRAA